MPALSRLKGIIAGKSNSMTFSIGAPKNIGVKSKLQNTITIVIAKEPKHKARMADVLVRAF